MDHNGLLTLTRQLQGTMTNIQQVRTIRPEWKFNGTALIYPETKCPFCLEPVRSEGIWFLGGAIQNRLLGAIFPEAGERVRLIQPGHPHDTGNGALCLGGHPNGLALFAHPANLRDVPMGSGHIPRWLKRYWSGHTCEAGRKGIREYTYDHARLLEELDAI